MQVPKSAIGRTGICPNCGRNIPIGNANTTPLAVQDRKRGNFFSSGGNWFRDRGGERPSEDAKRRFGQAADLFYGGRYAEALAIFDGLAREFPGNPEIESARTQCLKSMRRPPLSLPSPGSSLESDKPLDKELIKRIIVDKMLNGSTEAIQLQAAELAARMVGLFENGRTGANANPEGPAPEPTPHDEGRPQDTGVEPPEEENSDEDVAPGEETFSDTEEPAAQEEILAEQQRDVED